MPLTPRLILFLVFAVFVLCVLAVHLRGRAKLRFDRQLVDHSALFAPYNLLMYAFSAVPARPILDRAGFPQLDLLKDHWKDIREEAAHLFDQGFIRAAEKKNDASFNSFFKQGWKRFYLKWYGEPLPSAEALCPRTVELLNRLPDVKAAMFALLPPGSKLNPHRDPFAGSLRYHLGLITPNSEDCRIFVDGQVHAWRDGEDVVFDETYVHWAENRTDQTRVILFCDVVRPLRTRLMQGFNKPRQRLHGPHHRLAQRGDRQHRPAQPPVRAQPQLRPAQQGPQAPLAADLPRRQVRADRDRAVGHLPGPAPVRLSRAWPRCRRSTWPSRSTRWKRRAPSTATCWAAPRAARPTHGWTSISSATRSSPTWRRTAGVRHHNAVDGDAVPVPHFGVVLDMADWQALAERLRDAETRFVIEPHTRFAGQPGEQATMFLLDPCGNALEFKAFADRSQLFAR